MRVLPLRARCFFGSATRVPSVVLGCLLVGGCTTVTVRNAEVTETSRFGVVVLRIVPDRDVTSVVVSRGLGLMLGARSTTLGYMDETVFQAPDASACRAFILIPNSVEETALRHLLARQPQLSQVCVITKESP